VTAPARPVGAPAPGVAAPAPVPAASAQPAISSTALAGVGLFLAALGLGIAIAFAAPSGAPAGVPNPWPSLPPAAGEPEPAAALVRANVAGDAAAVAAALPAEQLDVLERFMEPVVIVDAARYLGGVERGTETIVGYVIEGRTEREEPAIVALTLRLRDGKVVGIQ
jgi:hypothetical protein